MNLSARIGRLEQRAALSQSDARVIIIGLGEEEASERIEDALLTAEPGYVVITVDLAGRKEQLGGLAHEDALKQLEGEPL